MNQTDLQQPKKTYLPLLAAALFMQGLDNRYKGNNNSGPGSGAPIPTRFLNQRQRRKLAAQNR
jgi:hypothetical protein